VGGVRAERWYVTTDAGGVEHTAGGPVAWVLPGQDGSAPGGPGTPTEAGSRPLVLRRPESLLDVLDERVWRAEAPPGRRGAGASSAEVSEAALVSEARWNSQVASELACACAEHVLGSAAGVTLPGGRTLEGVLADARRALAGATDDGGHEALGRLATVAALHRLRRDRDVLDGLEGELLVDGARRDLDALDDPDYEAVAPIVDAVLAAIEALRHHLGPQLYLRRAERAEALEQEAVLEGAKGSLGRPPVLVETPFGAADVGARALRYEPAWACASAAARHARRAASDESGAAAGQAERAWQADLLERALEGDGESGAGAP